MRFRRSAKDGDGGAFLDGTSSDLADFGETGSNGFASAWRAQADTREHDAPLDGFGPPDDDKRANRARDLDRRSRKGLVFLGVLVLAGAGAAIAVQQRVLSDPTGLTPETPERSNVIASIDDPRAYAEGPADVSVTPVTPVDSAFIKPADADPAPATSLTQVAGGSSFGPLFWGGRSHVAVAGPDLDLDTTCVVVSLVAEDLRVVDLAAYGACGDRYAATGDRAACIGPNIALLEVWPYDPDAVVPQPEVTSVRVRIEAIDPQNLSGESFRAVAPLDDAVLENAVFLAGRPGDAATVEVGSVDASCTLADRAEVPVQLL